MSFFMDREKDQPDHVQTAVDAPPGAIVSADVFRDQRIPPGQSRTKKWPVLDASGPPKIDLTTWKLRIFGMVRQPVELTWNEFLALPRVTVFSDFHCVTRWSRLGNVWEGVSTKTLLDLAGGPSEGAAFALAHGYDLGFTTNLPLPDLLSEDALIAINHDGQPISTDHGGPARLVVPLLYAWKSAKWISGLELLPADQPGFWESNGYHIRGDPWSEERYNW
ncbi:MAG: oxidoreductase, molybdopterin binding [Bryobacterales bacterium]|nr:oxidoreductase, molybdopterin binding [Bryobacterales bacterium]